MAPRFAYRLQIDLRELCVPITSCVTVSPGPIRKDVLEQLERAGYDQAPVLDAAGEIIGIVDTVRLRELLAEDRTLATGGETLYHAAITATTTVGELLEALVASRAALVVRDDLRQTLGLVTISDLNRHAVRRAVYGVLAELEDRLARLIEGRFSDSWQWLRRLGEDHQIRLLGYAELTRKRGVDVGPISACTLTQLLAIVGAFSELRVSLGFETRSKWDCFVGPIIDLRNKVMHPVRPMVLGHDDVKQLRVATTSLVEIHSRVRALGPSDLLPTP